MSPLVSVIVPFYNEEQYLPRAIESVLQQTHPHIELILVSDGSMDGSAAIARSYAAAHTNVVFIDADHCGPGKARNIGMAAATGSYIAFLDSDDELEPQAMALLIARIQAEQTDMVVSRFGYYNSLGKQMGNDGWSGNGAIADGTNCVAGMYEHSIASTVWAKLYRADFVRQISFPEALWFEDRPFLLQCFLLARKVSFEPEPLWKIHSRPSSVTRRLIVPRRIEDSCRIFLMELDLVKPYTDQPRYPSILYRHHIRVLMSTLVILCSDRKLVADRAALQKSFDHWLRDFELRLKKSGTYIGRRSTLDLWIMRLYRLLGWNLAFAILPLLKPEKFKSISKIREL